MTNKQFSVLIIDDALLETIVLSRVLADCGFNLLTATNGTDGIFIARREQPDLILLDLMMPGMDGFEVCRQLKNDSLLKHIPVIIITALHEMETAVKSFRLGAADYLTKPFNIEEILSRVALHLGYTPADKNLQQRLQAYRDNTEILAVAHPISAQAVIHAIERVKEYLLENLGSTVSMVELTRIAHTNRTTLSEHFKILHGISVFEWFREQRLRKAIELLSSGTMQVQQIAEEVGYNNIAAFSKAFKQRFGVSPMKYRRLFSPPTKKS